MIPVKLKVRNFMPYRDNVPALDFSGIHTACISGDNGNGKSALIDAITWALWGRTRAKSDDDLIHSGQMETEVEFDFAVGQQLYRIIRKHAKPRKHGRTGQTILELQIKTEDGFKAITGNSIIQTQQRIRDIVHMDYDTFINSAFLRQGHADEFTRQTPVKRKEVLSSVLDLSLYDGLEEQAKVLARKQETEKAQLDSGIKDIDAELAKLPAYKAELELALAELSRIESIIKEQDSRLSALRKEKESLDNKKRQLTQLEERIKEARKALERWDEQAKQHLSRVKEYEELISRRAEIEEGYTQLSAARTSNDALNHKLGLLLKLNERKSNLEKTIDRAGASLITEHSLVQRSIDELDASSQRLPRLKSELQQVQSHLRQLAEEEETLGTKRQSSQELQSLVNKLESNNTRLQQEIKEIEEKLTLLVTGSGARCPLCETELGKEGIQLIETKYTADRSSKSGSLQLNRTELTRKKTEMESLRREISQLEKKLNQEKATAQSSVSLAEKGINEAEDAAVKLSAEREKLAEIERRLAVKDFAHTEQAALRELENELARLDYDAQRHEQLRKQVIELGKYEEPWHKLDEADRLIVPEQEALSRAKEAALELQNNLEIDTGNVKALVAELESLPRIDSELAQAESEYPATKAQLTQAQETTWNVKGKIQRCSELETKRGEREKLLNQAIKEEQIYRDLAQAFGKRGIQALLIETALPEIEAEGNKLLGRMTDNRMHLKIETQRETKKGDVVDTLDINISDELGTRNYEMFSGGEAFRINFAIRVALSRLLARRAGAPLPTLIIDEGFGTQDNTGIEKLKEAINSIQDDFEKILVITHIDELRDAFPTRIDVIKTAEGSTLSVS